ncbi:bifunctional diaminohydroxyphosphoribosylaminopyrimidine deaminase/5-amino-6-(5-phosphoribosylamino)uracil reductase RibD [Enterovirga sp. DB1703]|uniref:Riboflavin biosynthesis protein RibD n=2 Tax=Enterovirga aerilata TaxID=2730920 RepID=A0A849IBE5_9HYPH|nr:bifunctional diaminohydroxyphosphoribosylaminopyrimidine deaminase/5-amino-6-(5-phosphoribosylamino)uracil reductase RibD [Enterovirga sp. DB1703]NNM73297.1 bifunctional diaminohydroxyphosphoribosylaminopyrimidine deaminase/5-amino-6-(5-phosphoribosylamino)uracil reductase RibD [Enterovirga sp. DB1703]
MRLALALGYRNLGRTWPNPSVGAVLVDPDDGRIVAVGMTQSGGRPHAERIALTEAGGAARGKTLYVSLEPCSHHGRTPPCAEAVIASGVSRVVTSLEDADGRVAGRGHAMIQEAGIALKTGVLAAEAASDHRGHFTRVREGRPAVTLKLAQTADGFAAAEQQGRLLITGEGANARTHMLRAHADAVLVGVSTVLADDPRLDVRLPGLQERSPVRIVLDSRLRTPPQSRLVKTAGERQTIILCGRGAHPDAERALSDHGARIIRTSCDDQGRIELTSALRRLGDTGLTRVLCEVGPTLADALARDDLVDEAVVITNERPLGRPGLVAIGPHLAEALRSRLIPLSVEQVGPDRIQVFERAP